MIFVYILPQFSIESMKMIYGMLDYNANYVINNDD